MNKLDYKELILDFSQSVHDRERPLKFGSLVTPVGNLSVQKAVEIYAEGYQVRMHDSLKEVFDATASILGDEVFRYLSVLYTDRFKSHTANIRFVGESFPAFLQESALIEDFPFLGELARFEWCLSDVFHSRRSHLELVNAADLNEDSKFEFTSSFRLFESNFSVDDLWNLRGSKIPSIDLKEIRKPRFLTLFRDKTGLTQIHSWTEDEFKLLKSIREGATLSFAFESSDMNSESQLTEFLQKILGFGFLRLKD